METKYVNHDRIEVFSLREEKSDLRRNLSTTLFHVNEINNVVFEGFFAKNSNSFIEGLSHKIRRQIEDLERVSGVVNSSLTEDGVPVDSFLTRGRFVWDEAKYPTMSPLREIVDGIHVQDPKIEDDLKVRVAEYNNLRSQINAINRKQAGSLAVRDLSNLVKPNDVITSGHLTTLIVIVPNYSRKDWLSSYETLTTFVVPRSSKKLHKDNEYALYTVTLFIRDADNFKTKARVRNFQFRDFEYNPETQESRRHELEKLNQDQHASRSSLLQWCYTSYGEPKRALTSFLEAQNSGQLKYVLQKASSLMVPGTCEL
ncbi:V-type proton ATPase subunit C [Forsythia ovata]|uniref:V-type proton ATPase subunit C n=1 Tax=Forsythia ovata TaxID=205694 RepID=A0ABD1TQL1_9LAMI